MNNLQKENESFMEKIKKWRNNYSNEIKLEKEELVLIKEKNKNELLQKGKNYFLIILNLYKINFKQ